MVQVRSEVLDVETASLVDVASIAEQVGYPVVLKPLKGSKGHGVICGISDSAELLSGYKWLTEDLGIRSVLLEEFVSGADYRVYVVGGKAVSVIERVPANVTADGVSTVGQLVELKNTLRSKNPFLSSGPISRDREVDLLLAEQGLEWESVVESGRNVVLRRAANASAGGDVIEKADSAPEAMKDVAVRAVDAIPDLASAGVDILYDETRNGKDQFVVLELNARAHIGVNMYPSSGVGRDVPSAILDAFFPGSAEKKSPNLDNVRFNLKSIAGPLQDGSAFSVTIRRIPSHGFGFRQQYRFRDMPSPVSDRLKGALRRTASRNDVSGRLDAHRKLLFLAGDQESVARTVSAAQELFGEEYSASEWRGVVDMGFYI